MAQHPTLQNLLPDLTAPLFSGALIPINNQFLIEHQYPLHEFLGNLEFQALGLDSFGDIFIAIDGGVARIGTETGEVQEEWPSISNWIADLRQDPTGVVGEGFLLRWQTEYGLLENGRRLTPKMPFIFGGTYEMDNIVSMSTREILAFRADIAKQIQDLPDGTRIMINTD